MNSILEKLFFLFEGEEALKSIDYINEQTTNDSRKCLHKVGYLFIQKQFDEHKLKDDYYLKPLFYYIETMCYESGFRTSKTTILNILNGIINSFTYASKMNREFSVSSEVIEGCYNQCSIPENNFDDCLIFCLMSLKKLRRDDDFYKLAEMIIKAIRNEKPCE